MKSLTTVKKMQSASTWDGSMDNNGQKYPSYTMLHPDVFWYHLNGMGTQKNVPKKVLVILFPYTFHVKTKWNIVYKYLKTKIFSRDTNILLQMYWTSNIFGRSVTTIGGVWVSLNHLIPNFNKTICPKNIWIQQLYLLYTNFYFFVFCCFFCLN